MTTTTTTTTATTTTTTTSKKQKNWCYSLEFWLPHIISLPQYPLPAPSLSLPPPPPPPLDLPQNWREEVRSIWWSTRTARPACFDVTSFSHVTVRQMVGERATRLWSFQNQYVCPRICCVKKQPSSLGPRTTKAFLMFWKASRSEKPSEKARTDTSKFDFRPKTNLLVSVSAFSGF